MNVDFAKRQATEAARLSGKLEILSKAVDRMKKANDISVDFVERPKLNVGDLTIFADVLNFVDFRIVLANYLTTEFHRTAKELSELSFVDVKPEPVNSE